MKEKGQLKKELMLIASNLPVVMQAKTERHILTKEEAIEQFPETDPTTFIYIPKGPNAGKVIATYPVQLACNHYRRLKKAYFTDGQKGVIAYIKKIQELDKEQSN
ncbi:MAG: hypothetical protein WCG90_08210 [Chitinophagia bacterium]